MQFDCTVEPHSTDILVLGRYIHAHAFVPRLQDLNDVSSMCDIADRMVAEMDLVYRPMVVGVEYDEEDATKQSNKDKFNRIKKTHTRTMPNIPTVSTR